MNITPPNHPAGILLRSRSEFSSRNFEVCPAPQAPLIPKEEADRISRIDRHFHREIFSDRSFRQRLLGTTNNSALKCTDSTTSHQEIETRRFIAAEPLGDRNNETAVQWKKQKATNIFADSLQKMSALLDSPIFSFRQKIELEGKISAVAAIFSRAICEIQNATSTYEIRQALDRHIYNTAHAVNSFWPIAMSPLGYAFEEQTETLLLKLGRRMDKHLVNSGLTEALSPATKNMLLQRLDRCLQGLKNSQKQHPAALSEGATSALQSAFEALKSACAMAIERIKDAKSNQNALDALLALRAVVANERSQLSSILESPQRDLLENWNSDFKTRAIYLRVQSNPHLNRRDNI